MVSALWGWPEARMSGPGIGVLLLLSAAFFGVGFGLSMIRARRRVRAQLQQRLQEEAHKRMAEEVLRRLREGELEQRIDAALRDELADSEAPEARKQD